MSDTSSEFKIEEEMSIRITEPKASKVFDVNVGAVETSVLDASKYDPRS